MADTAPNLIINFLIITVFSQIAQSENKQKTVV